MSQRGGEQKRDSSTSTKGGGQVVTIAREADVLSLAEALCAFEGDRRQGMVLRDRLAGLGQVRMRSDDPAVLAIRKAATLARAKRIDGDYGVGLDMQGTAAESAAPDVKRLAYLAPFLGIEADGAAVYHCPLTIDDQRAVAWAEYMAEHPVIPDERMRAFLDTLLDVRPRHLWRAAAEALAAFAARGDAVARDRLVELGERFGFIAPEGHPSPVAHGIPSTGGDGGAERQRHLRRHVRYAIACWLARAAPEHAPPALSVEIPARRLPNDPTEASIDVLCLGARLRSERDRDKLLPGVPGLLGQLDPDPVMEDALRFLDGILVDCAAQGAPAQQALAHVEHLLCEPSWLGQRERVTTDLLWSWLASIRLLSSRDEDLDRRLAARFPELADLVRFSRGDHGVADPVAAIMPRLRDLLDPARFAAKTRVQKALCVCETVVLLEHPDIQPLDWRALVSASLGTILSSPRAGTAGEVGLTEIIGWLASLHDVIAVPGLADELKSAWFPKGDLARYMPLQVIRDRAADPETIIALAAARHGWVVNQVAVQSERQLRRLHGDPAGQIRFLWRLLEVDPLDSVFTEIRNDLRGTDTTLHLLVDAIAAMDKIRTLPSRDESTGRTGRDDQTEKKPTLLKIYERLVNAAVAHLEGASGTRDDVVGLLRAALAAVGTLDLALSADSRPDLERLCSAIAEALTDGDRGPGLAAWFAWVDQGALETGYETAGRPVALPAALTMAGERGQSPVEASTMPSPVGAAWSKTRHPITHRDDLERCARELTCTVRPLLDKDAGWVPDLLDQAMAACARLEASLEGAPWPERIGLSRALKLVFGRLEEYREGAVAQQALADQVTAWVDARDAANLGEAIRGESLDQLAGLRPALLEAAHRVLRESGDDELLQDAEALRKACQRKKSHARLPPIVEHYIRERRADKVVETVDALDQHTDLGSETLARVNDFLLERLYLRRAARVRKTAAHRLSVAQKDLGHSQADGNSDAARTLPRSWLMHLTPLLIGMPAGTLLVLDVGTAWNEVLRPGYKWALYGTLGVSLLLAFVTLVGGLARQTADDARKPGFCGSTAWVLGMTWRALPVFVGAWLLAFVCSLSVLLSLAGTSETVLSPGPWGVDFPRVDQILLWSSLSLFLGIFLGLIAQGRGLYGRKAVSAD